MMERIYPPEFIFDIILNLTNSDVSSLNDEAFLKEYYQSIMRKTPYYILYLVEALEKKFGEIPAEWLCKYDLRNADEICELIKGLLERG